MTDNQNEPTAEINIEPPVSTDSSSSSTKEKDGEEGALPFPLASTSELMDIKNIADGMVEYETKVVMPCSITRSKSFKPILQEIEAELDKNEKQQQAEDPFQSQRYFPWLY